MDSEFHTTKLNVQASGRQFVLQIFKTPTSLAIARSILEGKTYPRVDFLKDVKLVIDIGANVGAASLFFALQYPNARTLSFEPCPESYRLLTQNMACLPNAETFAFGLFDRDCQVSLYLGKTDRVTNSIGSSYLNTERFVNVTLRHARDFCRERQIDSIDILKIDTEGCELPILHSLADMLKKTKVIYLEYHDEADRLAIDALLSCTHMLVAAKVIHPHRGELCYIAYNSFPSPGAIDQLRIRRDSGPTPPAMAPGAPALSFPPSPAIQPIARTPDESFGMVINLLQTVSPKLLLNRDFLISMIRAAGVRRFGSYDEYAEEYGAMLQDPCQFADALRQLSRYRFNSFVEIGSATGATACFMTAFLLRLNPEFQTTCVDPKHLVRQSHGLPVQYIQGTSEDVRNQRFDLAFIDGDHSLPWVARDYQNVGVHAPVCMFHDIDDADYNIVDPGKFWEHLRNVESEHQFFEFKYPGKHFMGIGIRVKSEASRS